MVWEPHEAAWEEGMQQLAIYQKEHGDCLVPRSHVMEGGYLLGKWVSRQRKKNKAKDSGLSKEQQARLAQRAKPPPGFRLVPAAERAAAEKATRKLLEETMALFLKVSHDVPASSAQGSRHR